MASLVDILMQQSPKPEAEVEPEQSTSQAVGKSPERKPLTFSDYAKILSDSQKKAKNSSEDQTEPSGE